MVQQDIRWIQRFEYTHELAWKVMKDYAEYQGYTDIRSSRDAIRKALEMGLIDDKQWTETIEARNLTSHNHDNDVVSEEKMQSLNTPFSDIDITLMGDRLTYNTLSSLSDEIDDLLLPYSVDLSIYGKLKNADLLEHIHRMGIPIFSRPSN